MLGLKRWAFVFSLFLSATGSSDPIPVKIPTSWLAAKSVLIDQSLGDFSLPAAGGDIKFINAHVRGEIGSFRVTNGILEIDKCQLELDIAHIQIEKRIVVDLPFVGRQERTEQIGIASNVKVSLENHRLLEVKLGKDLMVMASTTTSPVSLRLSDASKIQFQNSVQETIKNNDWTIRIGDASLEAILGPAAQPLQSWIMEEIAKQIGPKAVDQTFISKLEVPTILKWASRSHNGEVAILLSGWN